jgi:hypothetical protein
MGGAKEAQGGSRMGGIVLREGGEIEGAVAEQGAEQGGAQEREIAGAAGIAPEFGVFAPGDIAAIVVGTFDAPMAAAAGEPLSRGERAAIERGDKVASFAAGDAGFLVGHGTFHRDDGGGMREAQLARRDRRER